MASYRSKKIAIKAGRKRFGYKVKLFLAKIPTARGLRWIVERY